MLRQLLVPVARTSASEDWKAALPAWSMRLIDRARNIYERHLPEEVKMILGRLFTMRDDRESLELQRGVGAYTELLQNMSSPGRVEVLRALVQAFPQEPHYWGHLGRLLSYDAYDFAGALQASDKAISLAPRDSVLHHMRG